MLLMTIVVVVIVIISCCCIYSLWVCQLRGDPSRLPLLSPPTCFVHRQRISSKTSNQSVRSCWR
jgi:hypothetical protein